MQRFHLPIPNSPGTIQPPVPPRNRSFLLVVVALAEFKRVKLRTFGRSGPSGVVELGFQIDNGRAVPIDSELDEVLERGWDALVAAANGQKLEVPLTLAEKQWVENQKSMREFDETLKE